MARVLLASMFAIAFAAKMADRDGIRRAVVGFGAPAAIAGAVGWAMAIAELASVLLLLVGSTAQVGGVVALVLLGGFSAAAVVNLVGGRYPECHCFGRLSSGPLEWWTVARNGFFAALAVVVVFRGVGWPLAVAIVMLGLWLGPTWRRHWIGRAGATAADFALVDRSGQIFTLSALLGQRRPVLLVFSQPGCRACDALMPDIARWQHELAGRVTVALISGGSASSGPAVEHGLHPLLVDDRRISFAAYGITATPSAVLIDPDRRLVAAPARGARAIGDLVVAAAEAAAVTRYTRRRILGRVVGLASVTVLPGVAAVASGCGARSKTTTARDTKALAVDGAWICDQAFALCTTAPCVPSTTDSNIAVCDCVMQNGYSVGFRTCTERAQSGNKVRSQFSTMNVNPSFRVMTCPAGVPWANCLDVECEIDSINPAVAHCQCVTVKTGESLTFGGGCNTATCTSTIWSAATPDLRGSAQFKKGMEQLGHSVDLPPTCPAPS